MLLWCASLQKLIPKITDQEKLNTFLHQFASTVTLDQVNDLTSGVYAHSSLLAMTKDWNLFVEFCQSKSVSPLPASVTAFRQYIEKESKQKKYATLRRYVVTVSLVHKLLALPDPAKNHQIQKSLATIRLDKQGDAKQTHAFGQDQLEQLTQKNARSSSIRDCRNLAIYHVMFHSLMKRKDLRDLRFSQIAIGDSGAVITIEESIYHLDEVSTGILERWINLRGLQGEFVFTAIDRHENISTMPLNDSSIYRILRAASDELNLDVQFSGQSLRVGAIEQLAKQGMKPKEIQYAGRWLSPAMPYQYLGNKTQSELEKLQFISIKPFE